MSRVSQQNSRLVYDNAVRLLRKNNINFDEARLTQGIIRGEVLANTTSASYHIPVLINDTQNGTASGFNTEVRLALQDAFVVSEIYIGWGVPANATDTKFIPGAFDDVSVLTTAGAAAAIRTLYNGTMQISINNNVVVPSWDILRHYNAPITQGGVGITAQTVFPVSQQRGAEDGFYPMEPNVVLSGAGNIDLRLNLPAAIGTLQAGGFQRLIVMLRGVKAQNVTSVM